MAKPRLDVWLVEKELAPNRESAQRWIRAGKVLLNDTVIDKPGTKIDPDVAIRIQKPKTQFVGRGGEKLEGALAAFAVDVRDLRIADLGASTGGFTDCLLKRGAKKVYAIDVGRGQLAYRLQTDERVVVMDNTNCRYLDESMVGGAVDGVVGDLSFISIKTVFPAIAAILDSHGFAILLVKPQFEIGKGKVGKKGIVRDAGDHLAVLRDMVLFFEEKKWTVRHLAPSPIQGKSGNIEFLIHVLPQPSGETFPFSKIEEAVQKGHNSGTSTS
jgi:23S rRNA (cytidine1920-2'-O)/16S rRNA (cytidine1409-2'-O)-methyltransferase